MILSWSSQETLIVVNTLHEIQEYGSKTKCISWEKWIVITLEPAGDICSRQDPNLKPCVIHRVVQEKWGALIMGVADARSPGYYLHLASITQIIIDSASAVINNSHNVLHFPKCSMLSMLHHFVTVALRGRKSKDERTHSYWLATPTSSILLRARGGSSDPVFKEELRDVPFFPPWCLKTLLNI